MSRCHIIPPYLLDRVASSYPDDPAGSASRRTLEIDAGCAPQRAGRPAESRPGDSPFSIHTADNGTDLPGELVRSAGDPASGDQAVDEAYVGVEASLALFAEVYGRSSYDGKGAPVIATVHYEKDYDNAFWDGQQLVFGDGDGEVFERFTKRRRRDRPRAHPRGDRSTPPTSPTRDSPARSTSRCPTCSGRCLKQRLLGAVGRRRRLADRRGHLPAAVQGRALRSMKEPGTAYDDPRSARTRRSRPWTTTSRPTEDNGGVHINSGIPNRAFYLAATGIGGSAWDGAGQDLVCRPDLGARRRHRLRRASRRPRSRRPRTCRRRPRSAVSEGVARTCGVPGSAGTPSVAGAGWVLGRPSGMVAVIRSGGVRGHPADGSS